MSFHHNSAINLRSNMMLLKAIVQLWEIPDHIAITLEQQI